MTITNHYARQWVTKSFPPELADEIAAALDISLPAAVVLAARGIASVEQAQAFLNPGISELYNPFLLPDADKAVRRIRRAMDKREKILVYGDRDVDGVSALAVMVRTLRSLGTEPLWYIPSTEGYGLHKDVLSRYHGEGVSLVITVDCGISAVEEIAHGASLGMEFVVTDHHEPPEGAALSACAVVNPKLAHSRYPFDGLAGCMVSLKVAEALMLSFGKYFDEELAVVALRLPAGGAADMGVAHLKNGVAAAALAAGSDLKKMFDSIGSRRVVVFDDATGHFLRQSSKNITGNDFENEIIDLAPRMNERAVASGSLLEAASAMRLKSGNIMNASDEALLIASIFQRFEESQDIRMNFFRENHLDVVTLGTIADIVPLTGENRLLVREGLSRLPQTRKAGVQALLEKSGDAKNGSLCAKSISWGIAPLLNAAGRRGKADLSARLLLTDDIHEAYDLLYLIEKLNVERRALQAENMEKFRTLLEAQCDIDNDGIFIVAAEGVAHGVTGIVASQFARQYHRPTVLLIIENGQAMGAARSVPGFDIMQCFNRCGDLMVKYGGHAQAAGLTVEANKLDEFRCKLKGAVAAALGGEPIVPTLEIDAQLDGAQVTLKLVNELSLMEPFGMGNPYPVFGLRNMRLMGASRMGAKNDHLKLRLACNGGSVLEAVGWGMGNLYDYARDMQAVDLAVQLELNMWQDRKSVQMVMMDFRSA